MTKPKYSWKQFAIGLEFLSISALGGFVALLLIKKDASNIVLVAFSCLGLSVVCLIGLLLIRKLKGGRKLE